MLLVDLFLLLLVQLGWYGPLCLQDARFHSSLLPCGLLCAW